MRLLPRIGAAVVPDMRAVLLIKVRLRRGPASSRRRTIVPGGDRQRWKDGSSIITPHYTPEGKIPQSEGARDRDRLLAACSHGRVAFPSVSTENVQTGRSVGHPRDARETAMLTALVMGALLGAPAPAEVPAK